ncbi:hypothetical protein SPHINGOAX6_30342 [Sphingomonas sp. AX6]|nr:hypothetical protein SPHINGOAX6_30342 [Sphingomonas sp. AX6]
MDRRAGGGLVITAKAGIHSLCQRLWIPAFAGMTA